MAIVALVALPTAAPAQLFEFRGICDGSGAIMLPDGSIATVDDEGFITLVGRARDLFISGGENVYPAQVEETYLQHPVIREIAVIGVPDDRFGEVGCAYVVLAPGAILDEESLRGWGRERLATFKVPRTFVAVGSLPRTVTGKVQKHRLGHCGAES